MKMLVTGANGFVGGYAVRELLARGHEVFASDMQEAAGERLPAGIGYQASDVRDLNGLKELLRAVRPGAILHLGGIAFVPLAWQAPDQVFGVNTVGTMNVLAAARATDEGIRTLVVTSAEVYGIHAGAPGTVLDEDAAFAPENLYGVTKAAADRGAMAYAGHFGLDVMVARPSNHIGPGQSAPFVTTAFAKQLKEIAVRGAAPKMRVGNLASTRDFTDVRDVVRAYALLLEKGRPRTAYNIASGRTVAIREILDSLCEAAGVRPEVEVAPELYRTEAPRMELDTTRLRKDTGWRAEIPLEKTLRDIYEAMG